MIYIVVAGRSRALVCCVIELQLLLSVVPQVLYYNGLSSQVQANNAIKTYQ